MDPTRIPKRGEMWRSSISSVVSRVENVYDDCVTYWYRGHLTAATLTDFLARYSPSAPTVVGSLYLHPDGELVAGIRGSYYNDGATHAVQLMSDGDFRVVKL